MNVGERNDYALVGGDIDPGNTSHLILHAPQKAASAAPYLNASLSKRQKAWLARLKLSPARLNPSFRVNGPLKAIRGLCQRPRYGAKSFTGAR
jgi:hypothetical protein